MRSVKTAKGRTLDMEAIASKNRDTRAVGNGSMNANGDEVDGRGNIIKSVHTKQQETERSKTPPETTSGVDPLQTEKTRTPNKLKTQSDAEKVLDDAGLAIENETEKTRDDGSRYLEIEYEDGSIETKEINDE